MKIPLLYILLFASLFTGAQDQVYFLDGSKKTGKITEIAPDYITVEINDEAQTLQKSDILLIEFKSGSTEIVNPPQQSVTYNPVTTPIGKTAQSKSLLNNNQFSINTLALCNADISGFYERLLAGKRLGLGIMGAYNFNRTSSFSNLFITVLNSAKKRYDLGAFINLYTDPDEPTSLYFGMMIKYMYFTFNNTIEEKVTSGGQVSTNIRYQPTDGSQLATLFTGGTHTRFGNNFFIHTLFGIGGFNMRGDYRKQYNYMLNKASQSTTGSPNVYNRKFLLKLYLGINLGFSF